MKRRKSFIVPKSGLIDAEILQIIQLFDQPAEIADAVVVAVRKGLDVQLVDNRVLVPKVAFALRNVSRCRGGDRGSNIHAILNRVTGCFAGVVPCIKKQLGRRAYWSPDRAICWPVARIVPPL
jgi:hypothetical protein